MARAAKTAARRLDDEPGEGGGNDGVDRVAAGGEHPDAGLGFPRVARRTDAELGNDLCLGSGVPHS